MKNAPALIENELSKQLTRCTTARIVDYLNVIASRNSYNPILEKIQSIAWDKTTRLPLLWELLGISEDTEENKFSRIFIKKWLMMCICGLHNSKDNPFSLDICLILKGEQGAGKTRFFEALALNRLYFGEGVTLDPKNKDTIIQATSTWICELGEIGSTFKKDLDSLKALISSSLDEYREPYAKSALKYPRMTAFCGTVNSNEDEGFLVDTTGNRRFVIIPLADNFYIDYADIKSFDFLQLWAEINEDVENMVSEGKNYSDCFRFNRLELQKLEKRNGKFIKPLPAQREIEDILSLETNEQYIIEWKYQTATEFQENWDKQLKKYSSQQVGVVLNFLGCDAQKVYKDGIQRRLRKLPVLTWRSKISTSETEIEEENT